MFVLVLQNVWCITKLNLGTSSAVSDMICNWKTLKPPYILVGDTIYILHSSIRLYGSCSCKSVSYETSVINPLVSTIAVDIIKLFPC
jgi:hypothetical protein